MKRSHVESGFALLCCTGAGIAVSVSSFGIATFFALAAIRHICNEMFYAAREAK